MRLINLLKILIMMLIKDNSEFKNILIKVVENGINNTNNKIFIVILLMCK